ncbi:MAG: hypothetical protein ACM33T_12245 [Solirubrobacterales bacterium]
MSWIRPRSGLLSRLAGLMGRKDESTSSPPAPVPEQAPLTEDSFRLAIDQMRADGTTADAKLQVISLVEFREAVGDKWYRIADKVMMIAEGVIQLHLGAGNVFGRQGRDFFLLLFRTLPPAEARARALTIARELGTRLVGDKVLGPDRPLALAAEVALDDAFPGGTFNLGAVDAVVREIRSIIARKDEAAPDGLRSWMKDRLHQPETLPVRRHLQPGELPLPTGPLPPNGVFHRTLPKSSDQTPPPAWMRPSAPPGPKPVAPPSAPIAAPTGFAPQAGAPIAKSADPGWQPLNLASYRADGMAEDELPLPPDARLSMLWRPTWIAEGEAIGAYRAHLQRFDHAEAPALEGCHAYTRGEATAKRLDHYVVGTAMRDFLASERAGLTSTVILPIHWWTVYSPHRMQMLAPLADATAESRGRRLVIELFGIPANVQPEDLANVLGVLLPLAREVAVRTSLAAPICDMAARAGASLIGVDLSELLEPERTDDDRLLARLAAFHAAAGAAFLRSFVFGARRRKVIVGAVLGGYAMVNGPALMKEIAKPAKVLPAPRARFAAPA